tara:strand:- start:1981 stop:3201 length:1221 start_codon:yes stop_codon:yes gene_type:complete
VVKQKTLATFSSSATTLTAQQKSQVKATVEANPTAEKFICTGIRYYDQPMSVNITVRKRAKAACEYAKQLNPALSTWFQNKPTQARSYAGKVLLTVKSPNTESKYDEAKALTVAEVAYADARTYLDGSATAKPTQLVLSDSIKDTGQARQMLQALSGAISMWDEEVGVVDPYYVVYFRASELDWGTSQVAKYGGSIPFGSFANWTAQFSNRQAGDCGVAMSTTRASYVCFSLYADEQDRQVNSTMAHEYYHQVQAKLGINHLNFPVWLGEGSAHFVGMTAWGKGPTAIQDRAGNFASRYMTEWLGVNRISNYVKVMTTSDMVRVYSALEIGSTQESIAVVQNYAGYDFGGLAVERLVGEHGFSKFNGFVRAVGAGAYWKTQFLKDFGETPEAFYGSMLEYLQVLYK